MDSSRDNSFFRFKAFWAGLSVFLLAAIVLGAINGLYGLKKPAQTLEEAAAAERYKIRAEIDKAQAANFGYKEIEAGKKVQVAPQDVFGLVGKQLAATKPAPVKDEKQLVLNSPTAIKLVAGSDDKVMALGKVQFMVCAACHGQQGEGTAIAPPLANSEWVNGPVENLIRIQLRGLTGPISVAGKDYNPPAPMAPLAYQTDEQIAAVLTFIRNSFGNKASAVTAEQVTALRSEAGKPPLTAAELVKP